MNTKKKIFTNISVGIVGALVAILILMGFVVGGVHRNDYFAVNKVMAKAGFVKTGNIFSKSVSGIETKIEFDYQNGICKKNEYTFSIDEDYFNLFGIAYIKGDKMSEITNFDFKYIAYTFVKATQKEYLAEDWLEASKLVAHAGGAVRENNDTGLYTNSKEALVQNYDLGHRVFEFDFFPLEDGKHLALVHDWNQFGDKDGRAYTYEEWMSGRTYGSPETDSLYTPMTLDTLLDQMIVNQDMYVVTDTKIADENTDGPFGIIYETVSKKDPTLMERIIPQVYNHEMYDTIMKIYPFKSVIFTTYWSGAPKEYFIDFAREHENIHVITHAYWDERFGDNDRLQIHEDGKLVYLHTINDYSQMAEWAKKGIDGFYTDYLVPEDYEEYVKYSDVNYNEKFEEK